MASNKVVKFVIFWNRALSFDKRVIFQDNILNGKMNAFRWGSWLHKNLLSTERIVFRSQLSFGIYWSSYKLYGPIVA